MESGEDIVKRGESSRSAGSPSHDATRQNSDGPSVQDDEVDEVVSGSEAEDESGTGGEEPEEEDYEASRLKRIQENQLLLSSLGIQPALNADASSSSLDARPKVPVARKKRKLRPTVYDRSGYIISLPNPGEKHIMACVELPSDRKIRGRIEKGEYTNCAHWAAGEERRWRIGDGKHHYQAGEPVMIGGVGPDFRWRRWQGLHRELRNELVRRGELNEMDIRGTRSTAAVDVDGDVNPYSLIPGQSCHQCRRKSEKEKMRCRNTNPECKASFCESCCKRYSYFDFDPDSRSFICPLCLNKCNCSNCMRKRNLTHLLEKKGERTESLTRKLKKEGQSMTVESWLDQAVDRVRLPFDRVRIVCQDEDIISPELPPEPEPEKPTKQVKKARKSNLGPKGPSSNRKKKKKRVSEEGQGVTEPTKPVKLKFKIPKPAGDVHKEEETPAVREKQVDSDGDTVGGWSEDDPEPNASSSRSSSLTSMSMTPPRRLAFPPRPPMPQGPGDQVDAVLSTGFIRPEMMNQTSTSINFDDGHSDQSSVLSSDSGSSTPPPVLDEILAKKRMKPPPAANIIRLSKRIVHPAPQSNMESAKSKDGNSNSAYQGALGLHDPTSNPNLDPDAHRPPPSSPDPLLMDTDNDDNGNDHFFNGQIANRDSLPPPYTHSPPPRLTDTSVDVDRSGDTGNQNGPDSLFPDTPLWYTYNQHNRLSARSQREGSEACRVVGICTIV